MAAGLAAAGYTDYHTHVARCRHATGTADDIVRAAQEAGLEAVGISDHLPLLPHPDPHLAMEPEDLSDYVAEVTALKTLAPGYVLLGIEADYFPGRQADIAALLNSQPFDYVIGSVHYLDGWGFDNPANLAGFEGRDIDDIYRAYYETVGDVAETGLFTIIGHLDLVKKFGHRPAGDLSLDVDRLMQRLSRSQVLVEINTAGLRRPVGEIYPQLEVLIKAREAGLGITFGSDAHHPSEVGRDFALAGGLALSAGYTSRAVLRPRAGLGRADISYVGLQR